MLDVGRGERSEDDGELARRSILKCFVRIIRSALPTDG